MIRSLALLACCLAAHVAAGALGELPEIPLSTPPATTLGRASLALHPAEWRHAETEHFVYHFIHGFIATPVSVEAEAYYRFNVQALGQEAPKSAPKCHIYLFEKDEDWAAFQKLAALDPWTGGVLSGSDLFIQRNPALRWKGDTLAHEVAHLVVHQTFDAALPLWLDEGYAEFSATRAYASFHRARGYDAKPQANSLAPADYIPLTKLLPAKTYPTAPAEAEAFYAESQKLIRLISREDPTNWPKLLTAGPDGEKSLRAYLATRGETMEHFELRFRIYATRDHD